MDDFELRDVSVDTVTGSGIIANLVITGSAPKGATFINCVVPEYDSTSTYIHSMIKSDTEVTSLETGNNIVIAPVDSDGAVGGNLYLGKDTEVNGYVLRYPSTVPDLMNASVLRTWKGDDDLYELLEEDIAARGVYVEYQNGANQKGTTDNKSVEKLVRVSSQMLSIWAALGFKEQAASAKPSDGDYDEL